MQRATVGIFIIAGLLGLSELVIFISHSIGTTLVALIPLVLALGIGAAIRPTSK